MKLTSFTDELAALPCPQDVKTRAANIAESLDDAGREALFRELKELSLQFATVSAEEAKLMDEMETHVLHGEKKFAAADRKDKEDTDRKHDEDTLTKLLDA